MASFKVKLWRMGTCFAKSGATEMGKWAEAYWSLTINETKAKYQSTMKKRQVDQQLQEEAIKRKKLEREKEC